jgi:hypothetical protein
VQVQVDLERMDLGEEIAQVRHRPAEAVNAPGHHDVEFPACSSLAESIELRPLGATLGAADPLISEDGHDLAAHARGSLPKLPLLIHRGLLIGADPQIQRDPVASRAPLST